MKRRILVTGSSRGIGRATAILLAQNNFDVTVHGRTESAALQEVTGTIRQLGNSGHNIYFDVANQEQAKQVLEQDIQQNGAYYGIVLNAGITRDGAFPSLSSEDWQQVIYTALDGFYNVIQPLIMPMIKLKQGGRIVTLSSVSGLIGNRGQVNYSAAKGGVIAATKALALELAKRKITVNCVAPGLIDTDMVSQEVIDHALKAIPMQRMGSTEEVASLVNYLCSDNAGYITRQVISVNGGLI